MLKFYRNVLAAGVVALGLAACGDNVTVTNPPTATPVVHSVTVVPASVTATVGQAGVTFVASVVADSGLSSAVTWTSTNPTAATVSAAGVITALAPGQTTIVATSVGDPTKTGAGSLTVVALPPNISAFTVTPTNANIAVGGSLQASSQVTTANGAPSATVTWASSNANIATVSATGQITGVSSGTVVVTATATSGTQTATATIGVTVGSGPPGVISFSVSPSAMTLFSGQTQQATATVTVAPTFTAPTVTWTSLAPTVATVSSTGLVTAVAQGTAVITASIGTGAQTLTQSIVVTVAQSASISIAAVNAGATAGTVAGCAGTAGLPVVLANVNCQIDVVLNLTAGLQPLDSLVIYIQRGTVAAGAPTFQGKASPTCAAASAPCAFYKLAAKQVYGNTIPSTGPVNLSIFTQNFTKVPATGVAVVDYFNGPTSLVSQLFPHNLAGGQVTDCQVAANDPTCSIIGSMIFTNNDGWAADIGKCETANTFPSPACPAAVVNTAVGPGGTNSSTGGFAIAAGNGNILTAGSTFWGGPTNSGMTVTELYPVVYNDNPAFPSGSSLNRCNNTLGNGTGCITSVTWTLGAPNVVAAGPVFGANCGYTAVSTQTTQPFIQRFGSGTGTNINPCATYQNITAIRDDITMANNGGAGVFIAPLDGTNNPFPAVGVNPGAGTGNSTLIPNTLVFGATPDSARYDYCMGGACNGGASSVVAPQVQGAEAFNWVNQNWIFRPAGTVVTDVGVGPSQASWSAFATANGAPGATTTFPTLIVNGAGPLAETNVNCTIAGCGAGGDGYLAKAWATDLLGNFTGSPTTAAFGVDRTSPSLRYSTIAAPSSFASSYVNGGAATLLDSTSYNAFQGIYGANSGAVGSNADFFIGAAAGTDDSMRVEAQDGRSGVSRFVENTRRFAQGGATGTSTSVFSISTADAGVVTVDGWTTSFALHVTNGRNAGAPPVTPGYYTTTEYVIDRAGNVSGCPVVNAAAGGNPTGTVLGTTGFIASICPAGAATTVPSTTAGTNLAIQAGTGTNANLFFRRTLALDPGQPLVTGVNPNNAYTGNSSQTFNLGAQDDLEVVDSRLRIQYPNLTIGDAAGTIPAKGGLVWSYALSATFMPFSPNGATGTGPSFGNAAPALGWVGGTTSPFGYFLPIGIKFDNSIVNPIVTGLNGIPAMTLDQFTLNVQETCVAAAAPVATCGAQGTGDPISTVSIPLAKPTNVGVQVRDVFGSFVYDTLASATTGVATEVVVPILPATVSAPGSFAVTYGVAPLGAASSCPQGGNVQPAGSASCVIAGVNFRAEPTLSAPGATEVFRSTESLSQTLPIWARVDLYGLDAAGAWTWVARCQVPAAITVNAAPQACTSGANVTVQGVDNGNERYWLYSFTNLTGGFTFYRAIGTNASGFGLASTRQP